MIAHASREAIETLVFYAAILEVDAGVLGYLGEVDRKLMALTFAAFHMNYDSFGPRNDGRVWNNSWRPRTASPTFALSAVRTALNEHTATTRGQSTDRRGVQEGRSRPSRSARSRART